jgi:hypothetical protein
VGLNIFEVFYYNIVIPDYVFVETFYNFEAFYFNFVVNCCNFEAPSYIIEVNLNNFEAFCHNFVIGLFTPHLFILNFNTVTGHARPITAAPNIGVPDLSFIFYGCVVDHLLLA